jgi:hypothetical protein
MSNPNKLTQMGKLDGGVKNVTGSMTSLLELVKRDYSWFEKKDQAIRAIAAIKRKQIKNVKMYKMKTSGQLLTN